jgi:hypothetical protein
MRKELFLEIHKNLAKQIFWLERSYLKSINIDLKSSLKDDEFDILETLSSRYARTIDFLVRKYWRALDEVEFETQGTLIDVVNRAEKRNFFTNIEEFREMKDIRNDIVHEYINDELNYMFIDVLKSSNKLIYIAKISYKYGEKYI